MSLPRPRPGPAAAPAPGRPRARDLAFGTAVRPRRGEGVSGDCLMIRAWEDQALCGVIDGLGHGPTAREAALAVSRFLAGHARMPLEQLFEGAGRAVPGGRGVVMALARIDLGAGSLFFAGIGNIEGRLAGQRAPCFSQRGIVGLHRLRPPVTRYPWGPASLLVLHSDGVRPGWRWQELAETDWADPGWAAHRLLGLHGRPEDDASVLIVRGRPHEAG